MVVSFNYLPTTRVLPMQADKVFDVHLVGLYIPTCTCT
jgi:hypothetical protein